MITFITVIHIATIVLLVIAVLLQSGKGAEISATFGGSSQTVFGSSGGQNFFQKLTYGLAAVFMVTSLTLTIMPSKVKKSVFEGYTPTTTGTGTTTGTTPATGTAPGTANNIPAATTGAATGNNQVTQPHGNVAPADTRPRTDTDAPMDKASSNHSATDIRPNENKKK